MASRRKRTKRIDSSKLLPVVSMVTESFRARRKRRKRKVVPQTEAKAGA